MCLQVEVFAIDGVVEGAGEVAVDVNGSVPDHTCALIDVVGAVAVEFYGTVVSVINFECTADGVEGAVVFELSGDAAGAVDIAIDGAVVVNEVGFQVLVSRKFDVAIRGFERDGGVGVIGEGSLVEVDVAGGGESDGVVVVEVAAVIEQEVTVVVDKQEIVVDEDDTVEEIDGVIG